MMGMPERMKEMRLRFRARPTILVLENAFAIRELLVELLEAEGFEVLSAADGPTALDLARKDQQRIDLLLTGANPRGMDVQELTRELYRRRTGMKILFMAGKFDEGIAQILGDQAERLFLLKPFTRQTLLQKINDILG
jgi:two-component system cell cycle sensor histidine kinase/response regulator CckA